MAVLPTPLVAVVTEYRPLAVIPAIYWDVNPTTAKYRGVCLDSYFVANCFIRDGRNVPHECVIFLMGEGGGDMNTGLYGMAFFLVQGELHRVAKISSVGDCQTRVEQYEDANTSYFTPHDKIQFFDEENDNDSSEPFDFNAGLAPGHCVTQLERIVGMIILWMTLDKEGWLRLPASLMKRGDRFDGDEVEVELDNEGRPALESDVDSLYGGSGSDNDDDDSSTSSQVSDCTLHWDTDDEESEDDNENSQGPKIS